MLSAQFKALARLAKAHIKSDCRQALHNSWHIRKRDRSESRVAREMRRYINEDVGANLPECAGKLCFERWLS